MTTKGKFSFRISISIPKELFTNLPSTPHFLAHSHDVAAALPFSPLSPLSPETNESKVDDAFYTS
jgi:hypothetical protein